MQVKPVLQDYHVTTSRREMSQRWESHWVCQAIKDKSMKDKPRIFHSILRVFLSLIFLYRPIKFPVSLLLPSLYEYEKKNCQIDKYCWLTFWSNRHFFNKSGSEMTWIFVSSVQPCVRLLKICQLYRRDIILYFRLNRLWQLAWKWCKRSFEADLRNIISSVGYAFAIKCILVFLAEAVTGGGGFF